MGFPNAPAHEAAQIVSTSSIQLHGEVAEEDYKLNQHDTQHGRLLELD